MERNVKFLAAAFALVAAGCGGGQSTAGSESAPTPAAVKVKEPTVTAEAGIPVTQQQDPDGKMLVAKGNQIIAKAGTNKDPFGLKPNERSFESQQNTERVLGSAGGWTVEFTPPEPKPDDLPPVIEPQPYRRLAGVVVGDSVLAIIDLGDGTTALIRPGMQLPPPNQQWKVISIDEEKAVLRRSGPTLPHQVIVRLESPPAGTSSGPASGGFGGPSGFGPGPGSSGGGKGSAAAD